jgi:hypothetical protein
MMMPKVSVKGSKIKLKIPRVLLPRRRNLGTIFSSGISYRMHRNVTTSNTTTNKATKNTNPMMPIMTKLTWFAKKFCTAWIENSQSTRNLPSVSVSGTSAMQMAIAADNGNAVNGMITAAQSSSGNTVASPKNCPDNEREKLGLERTSDRSNLSTRYLHADIKVRQHGPNGFEHCSKRRNVELHECFERLHRLLDESCVALDVVSAAADSLAQKKKQNKKMHRSSADTHTRATEQFQSSK